MVLKRGGGGAARRAPHRGGRCTGGTAQGGAAQGAAAKQRLTEPSPKRGGWATRQQGAARGSKAATGDGRRATGDGRGAGGEAATQAGLYLTDSFEEPLALRLMSRALTLWVRAPKEMKSTPALA